MWQAPAVIDLRCLKCGAMPGNECDCPERAEFQQAIQRFLDMQNRSEVK